MAHVTLPKQAFGTTKTIDEPKQASSPVYYEWEEEILETYKTYTEGWGLKDSDAKQKIMDEYHISSAELERILGGK